MGGKLSKKKKGCYGDHTDEAADEPSETPVDQKEDETNVKQELNSDHTLKGEQPASNGLQSEEKSKNELQVGETVNHVKEESEVSNDQTKEGQISPNSEDLKLAQAKSATSEIKVNCEGTHSEPGSAVSAESKPEETKSAIVEKKDSEICPNNTSENKAKETPTTIQSTGGANENPTECTADRDKNVNGADEPVSSISTENTCSAQSVEEKDSICLNTVKPSVNSACSKPPTDVGCQDTPPSALQESPNTKNNSEGRSIDGGLLKSSDEVLQVSCGDTLSKQSLVDSSTIESVKTAISNSDNLIKSTESHKDESNNCELLNTAQETKSECLNTENRCGVKQDSCTAQGEDIGVIAREGECSAQKHQDAPEDQTSTLSETKSDHDSGPKLEDSVSLEGSIAPPKVETQAETKIVDEATEVTVIGAENITAQAEVTSTAMQKASLDPVEVEPIAEVQIPVTLVQSTSEVEPPLAQMEVESTSKIETCVTPVAEESSTEPEASGALVEESSLVDSPSPKTPAADISSSEMEPCIAPEKATSEVELEGTVATLASSSESKVATMEEASLGKIIVDEVEVSSAAEMEVSSDKLADCTAQKDPVAPAEAEEGSAQKEAASPEEQGAGADPEQATSLCKVEDSVAQMHITSQAEMEDSVVNGEGTSAPEIVTSEHISSTMNASPVELDCPAAPEVSIMPIEQEEHATTEDTPDIAKVEADATPVDLASSNSDPCKDLAELITMKDSDTCNAQENQGEGAPSGEGQEATEEKYQEEPDSKLNPEAVQEMEIKLANIKENEVQNAADLKIEGSSECVISAEVPQNSEVVLNGDS
ncbi:uncharacterized protein LOC144797629 [Lissotriton helveticus]